MLTRAQRAVLEKAKRHPQGRIEWIEQGGGARRRMLERMRDRRLVEGPPWQITGLGEDALIQQEG